MMVLKWWQRCCESGMIAFARGSERARPPCRRKVTERGGAVKNGLASLFCSVVQKPNVWGS